jgi:hypothetical protein
VRWGIYRARPEPARRTVRLAGTHRYHRAGCRAPSTVLLSMSTSRDREFTASILGARPMTKDLFTRTRRLALTVGPLVAIALSLAAGWKW